MLEVALVPSSSEKVTMAETLTTGVVRAPREAKDGIESQDLWVKVLSAALIALGTLSRLAPLADPHGRLLQQFATEDGYYMQTVARNLALGHGLSISDGTIQTNGVQPLATFLFALFHYLAGGDKVGGIAGVMLFSFFVSVASAWAFYSLSRKLLRGHPDERMLSMLVASLWFASPTIVGLSMNGLETGLYLLVSLVTLNLFANLLASDSNRWTLKQMAELGFMFGLCFLVRNDAAFMIAAVLLTRWVFCWPTTPEAWRQRIIEAFVPGLISIVIALPWLIYNYRLFGSIVPISGISEALDAHFGGNLIQVPAPLFDFVTLVLPIPLSLRTSVPVVCVGVIIIIAACVLGSYSLWRQSRSARPVLVTYGVFGALLIGFYGLYFGAMYFMSRYLVVLSPICALCGFMAAYQVMQRLIRADLRWVAFRSAMALALVLAVGLNLRIYHKGQHQDHFQVVGWVERHVTPATWVGAPQSGTLGYFHDRTINLDGKVDPEALRAKLVDGSVLGYAVASKIKYIVDWFGIGTWSRSDKDGFNRKFQLIVSDRKANLAVLERIDESHD